MRARVKQTTTWISKSKTEIENEEEILACRRIILKIVRCTNPCRGASAIAADEMMR